MKVCEVCGASPVEGHHDDYAIHTVRWLCIPHHKEWHKHNTPANRHLNLKLRIDTETLRAIEALAKAGDRNVSQEIRRAIRKHVAEAEAAA